MDLKSGSFMVYIVLLNSFKQKVSANKIHDYIEVYLKLEHKSNQLDPTWCMLEINILTKLNHPTIAKLIEAI